MKGASAREFLFTDEDFRAIRRLVMEQSGISLSEMKRDMVYARLSRRIRKLGLKTFAEYLPLVEKGEGEEVVTFVNAITTNLTSFFREEHHFEFLAQELVPELMEKHARSRRIRIWSAGCSSGCEPYSIAMVLRETLPDAETWDVKILASDLDTDILAEAERGVYGLEKLKGVSKQRQRRWFWKGKGENAGTVRVASELRKMITFRQLNLMAGWPLRGSFDVIFCRNVLIYFDKPTQNKLFERWAEMLVPGGSLFLGHSESMTGAHPQYESCGRNRYRRKP
jgi:chemotaxis protein methyltransferase CheR